MKNIHILTTSKPSRLLNCIEGFRLFEEEVSPDNEWCVNVNIHITSDEEIKEGDWFIAKNKVLLCTQVTSTIIASNTSNGGAFSYSQSKKIILTTDQDLIKDGVQSIDDEFLELFVKNPSCEEVKVKEEIARYGSHYEYKIIIPKEEPKKVLTEEDIFNQKDIDVVTDYINKEQQKQHLIDMMKSDEELGLYDDIEINRIEVVCKDCSDSLEDCTCIKSTVDFAKQEIKLEEVFNDEKKENIKKFIDEIKNPSEPNQALKDAAQRYQERMYSEEEVIAFGEFIFKHTLLAHSKGVKNLFEQFKKK